MPFDYGPMILKNLEMLIAICNESSDSRKEYRIASYRATIDKMNLRMAPVFDEYDLIPRDGTKLAGERIMEKIRTIIATRDDLDEVKTWTRCVDRVRTIITVDDDDTDLSSDDEDDDEHAEDDDYAPSTPTATENRNATMPRRMSNSDLTAPRPFGFGDIDGVSDEDDPDYVPSESDIEFDDAQSEPDHNEQTHDDHVTYIRAINDIENYIYYLDTTRPEVKTILTQLASLKANYTPTFL